MKKTSVKKLIVTVTTLGVLACFPLVSFGAGTQPPQPSAAPFNRPIVPPKPSVAPFNRPIVPPKPSVAPFNRPIVPPQPSVAPFDRPIVGNKTTQPEPIFRILPMPTVHIQ